MSDLSQETLKTEINKELASFKILPKLLILIPLVFLPLFFHDGYIELIASCFNFCALPILIIINEIFLIRFYKKANSLFESEIGNSLVQNNCMDEKQNDIHTLKSVIISSQWFCALTACFYLFCSENLIYLSFFHNSFGDCVGCGLGAFIIEWVSFAGIFIIALITLPAVIFSSRLENRLRGEFPAFRNLIILKIILYPLCLITGVIGIYGFLQLWH